MLTRIIVLVLTVNIVNAATKLQLNVDPVTWTEAYSICSGLGSHLAVVRTQQDADLLAQLLTDNDLESVHVGVSDLQVEGRYTTVVGEPLSSLCFDQWAEGAPIGGSSLNCGSYSAAGLTDADCALEKPFVCDIRDDYDWIEGVGSYKYHTVKANWNNAVQRCESEGAHLLILNSEEELAALHQKYQYIWVWVGVHNVFANQQFVTIYNQPLERTGFSRWRTGDPTGDNLSHPYVALQGVDGVYSSPGGNSRDFICEKEIQ